MKTDYPESENSCIIPDILESSSLQNISSALENHPDLLHGVESTKEMRVNMEKEHDDFKMVNTPMVDIIGDFGQEVEREFGLLVNGYKNQEQLPTTKTKVAADPYKDVINSSKDNTNDNVQEELIKSRKQENDDNNNINSDNSFKKKEINFQPIYQKHSFDERQLPLIGVDYSRCQALQRTKSKSHNNTNLHGMSAGNVRQRDLKKRNQQSTNLNINQDVDELNEYKSRYANNNSSWAQYLKDTKRSLSPNALELFDAYKISNELDQDTLKKHLKLAKEIEKKRRSNRDEIRRRLAGLGEDVHKNAIASYTDHDGAFSIDGYASSDSYSSDSETCPKLSRKRQMKINSGSGSNTPSKMSVCAGPIGVSPATQDICDELNFENEECDFFTKQAVLQIETRMALAQSKEIAHWQLTMEKQRRSISPITEIVQGTMIEVGYQMPTYRRRITRQILTNMSLAHLKILVNNFHTNIENFNVQLMSLLMKRDDLHLQQDELLSDIEEMTKYLGVNFTKQLAYPN